MLEPRTKLTSVCEKICKNESVMVVVFSAIVKGEQEAAFHFAFKVYD